MMCPACHLEGPHYVGPSFGQPGYFLCQDPDHE